MDSKYCPICLCTEADDDREWTTWPCGHSIHTACALQNALRGNVSCAMCRALLVEDEDEVMAEREFAQRRALIARRQHVFQRAIRMSERNRPASLARTIKAYERAKNTLKSAREDKAKAMMRVRDHRDVARAKGMEVRLDPVFCRRVWRAERGVSLAKRRIQDEMLLLDEV